MDLLSALQRMESISGWFSKAEAELLFRSALHALVQSTAECIVEIGSYQGRSTVILGAAAQCSRPTARVYAIDPHNGKLSGRGGTYQDVPSFSLFCKNIDAAGLQDTIIPIKKFSFEVTWNTPIALLLIDGLHDYKSVVEDHGRFSPWVAPGGLIAFHDCPNPDYPDVQRFVNELESSGKWRKVDGVDALSVIRQSQY